MKLFIDVGNTAIKFACDKDFSFNYLGRFFTRELSDDKLDKLLSKLENIKEVDVASVVPNINKKLDEYFLKKYNLAVRYIKIDDYPRLKIEIDNKAELGMDLYCDLVGALANYGPATLVTDLGTASKILLVNKDEIFNTCVILPGLEMSKEMLSKGTALLPNAENREIKNISEVRNTVDVINSSVYFGHIEMINGLLNRYEKEIGYSCKHVFTGGNAKRMMKDISGEYILDETLCLKGIYEIVK